MDDRDFSDQRQATENHWELYAEALDLTIEGHRLIAQEIGYETKLLWRGALTWLRLIGLAGRRGSPPPI